VRFPFAFAPNALVGFGLRFSISASSGDFVDVFYQVVERPSASHPRGLPVKQVVDSGNQFVIGSVFAEPREVDEKPVGPDRGLAVLGLVPGGKNVPNGVQSAGPF